VAARTSDTAHPGTIADWCGHHLGSRPVHSFITEAPASQLWGFELADGRVVAVKVRPASARLDACTRAHRRAHAAGIDAPLVLAGPAPFGDDGELAVIAETWRPDGAVWPERDPAESYGRLLASIVAALEGCDPAPLAPPPPHLRYDHDAAGRLWPPSDIPHRDPESALRDLPAHLVHSARLARERLLAATLPTAIGHGDLSGVHVRWLDGFNGLPLAVVHGWEELAARPEAVLAGCLVATFTELPDQLRLASVADGERVLAAYQMDRGRAFSAEEREVAWAASIWVGCYQAAMEHVAGAAGQVTHQLTIDAGARLRLAGC
jgi:hypothetical protein